MKIIRHPQPTQWAEYCKRPVFDTREILGRVKPIIEAVKSGGDRALRRFTERFDGVALDSFVIGEQEIQTAADRVHKDLKAAIRLARENIRKFHESQRKDEPVIETTPGVLCWRKPVAIEKVGLYIPGGSAPLFSTLLMLGVPAQLAGCREIILCTPPNRQGEIHPAILFTAHEIGIPRIFKVGGAQAIAAMAYGTETIPAVDKIFGPGNQYVTAAKQLISLDGVAMDLPAGPSEVAVLADDSADPAFIAADLLSQAEHGADSQVVLVTNSEKLLQDVQAAQKKQLPDLPRAEIAEQSLQHALLVLTDTIDQGMDLINAYAPEHLIIQTVNAEELAGRVINAGSVFIGPYTPESAGDYASGTNHTLPTNGYARSYSGVSLDSFFKQITFQRITAGGLQQIGPAIEVMAAAEELQAHQRAVSIRLQQINEELGNG